MALTPRQEAFAQEYLIDLNGTQAAVRAGCEVCEKARRVVGFYTYALCDPTTGRVFYVGKGIGRRAWDHTSDAKAGRIMNPEKHAVIRKLLVAGAEPVVVIVDAHPDSPAALKAEAALIVALDRANLTNIKLLRVAPGETEKMAAAAKDVLLRMKSLDEWIAGMSEQQAANAERYFGGPQFFHAYCEQFFRSAAGKAA